MQLHGRIEPSKAATLQVHVRPTYSMMRRQRHGVASSVEDSAASWATGKSSLNTSAALSPPTTGAGRPGSASPIVHQQMTSYEEFRQQLRWEEQQARRQFARDVRRKRDDVSEILTASQGEPKRKSVAPKEARPPSAASGVSRQTLDLLKKSLDLQPRKISVPPPSVQRPTSGIKNPHQDNEDRGSSIEVLRMVDTRLAQCQEEERAEERAHERRRIFTPKESTIVEIRPNPPTPSLAAVGVSLLETLQTENRTFITAAQRNPQYDTTRIPGDGRKPLIDFPILTKEQLEALKSKTRPGSSLQERRERASRKRKAIDESRQFWKTTKKNPSTPKLDLY